MLQNDLIMRMIETIAIAMKQILAAGDSGDMKTVASELDEASRLLVGVEFWVLSTMSVNDVLGMLHGPDGFEPTRASLVCGLLLGAADAEIAAEKSGGAWRYRDRAARFFEVTWREAQRVDPSACGLSRVYWNILTAVGEQLAELPAKSPDESRARRVCLFSLRERCKRFGGAEDLLFELLEEGWDDALTAGTAFYERLLELDDVTLAEGNLPRDEVEEGLAALRERLSV